jgi:glycolate oxidase FAD binding subunit
MHSAVLEKLRSLVGAPHVLTGIDLSPYVVEGRTPYAAVFPGSLDEVRAVVALAAEAALPIMPWGGGTAATIGVPPPRSGIVLGLRRLDRLVEHEPGDLTATIEAGMTLEALQARLRTRGQWLSLDAPDAGRATLGGIIAANASGPRRQLYGTMRDLLIGVTIVTAEGEVVHGGGKVVKNVAGYDLPKLFIGSHGTLGVIAEATVKLRPVPEAERFVAVPFDRLKDAGAAVRLIMSSDLIPNALELLDAEAIRARGIGTAGPTLVVGFDGLPEQVDWQCGVLAQIATPLGGHPVVALAPAGYPDAASATLPGTTAAVVRFSVLPTVVTELMEQGAAAARDRGLTSAWEAHAGAGVVTATLFSADERQEPKPIAGLVGEWRAMARASGGYATLERAPLAVKSQMPVWDDLGAATRLMQRIKAQLDPKDILNPGRFIGGI